MSELAGAVSGGKEQRGGRKGTRGGAPLLAAGSPPSSPACRAARWRSSRAICCSTELTQRWQCPHARTKGRFFDS